MRLLDKVQSQLDDMPPAELLERWKAARTNFEHLGMPRCVEWADSAIKRLENEVLS